MNVKIYMYKCNVYDNSNKRIKFHSKLFLYMYYLISKYGVGGVAFGNKLLRKFNS